MKGRRDLIPKEERIEFEGAGYIIQKWDESPMRSYIGDEKKFAGEEDLDFASNQWTIHSSETALSRLPTAVQPEVHMGCSKIFCIPLIK